MHYQGFPESEIIDFKNEADILSHYKQSFKEACFLQYGTAQAAQVMTEAEYDACWSAIADSNLSKFKAMQESLSAFDKQMKNLAIRVIPVARGTSNFKIIRRQFTVNAESIMLSLEESLKLLIPGVSISSSKIIIAGIEPSLETQIGWLCHYLSHPDKFLYVIVVHDPLP